MNIDFTDEAHEARVLRGLDADEIAKKLSARLSSGISSVSNKARGRNTTPIRLQDGRDVAVEWVWIGKNSVLIQYVEFPKEEI